MEFNEQTELTSEIDSRLTVLGGDLGVKGWSKKEKELTDTDNTVVIGGGAWVEVEEEMGVTGNEKTQKTFFCTNKIRDKIPGPIYKNET